MTQEKHQSNSQTGKTKEDFPIMRRSRSLSELPGHLRVQILRRKDTERTQARLEAGAAGVEELRVLREQHQQLVDQTMAAAAQQKARPQSHHRQANIMADHHRLQHQQKLDHSKQQILGCSPISAWHSTSSLTSISEERDSTVNVADNKRVPRTGITVSDYTHCQDNVLNASTNQNLMNNSMTSSNSSHHETLQSRLVDPGKNHIRRESECSNQHTRPQKQTQRLSEQVSHSQEKKLKSSIVKTTGLTDVDNKKIADSDEFDFKTTMNMYVHNGIESNIPSTQFIPTRNRSLSQDHIYNIDHKKVHDITDKRQRQRIMYIQSSQQFSRGRSQSVHDNFSYFSCGKDNESERSLSSQSNLTNNAHEVQNSGHSGSKCHVRPIMTLQEPTSVSGSNYVDQHSSVCVNTNKCEQQHSSYLSKCDKRTMLCTTASNLRQVSFCPMSRVASKSISWDNLLVAIGLQSESSDAVNEITERDNENNNEVFVDSPLTSNEKSASFEQENIQVVQRKKMRSQSFTSGGSINPKLNSWILKTECPSQGNRRERETEENKHSQIMQNDLLEHQKQAIKDTNSTSLLRRASIQCEAILTQTTTPRKIVNPLQDVDIRSLKSPGPLHAVTLQYSNIPMRKVSESSTTTASRAFAEDSSGPPKISSKTETSYSTPFKHAYHNLSPIIESGPSPKPVLSVVQFTPANSKVVLTDPTVIQQDIQKERPVPRPRTSIVKMASPQVSLQEKCSTKCETNKAHSTTSEFINQTETQEENKLKDDTLETCLMQNTDISELSSMLKLVTNKEPTCLTNTINVLCSSSKVENREHPIQNHDFTENCIRNVDLRCTVTAKADKEELKTLREVDKKCINEQDLSISIDCPVGHKNTSLSRRNSKLDSDIRRNLWAKSINQSFSMIAHTPSLHKKPHFNKSESQMPKIGNNGSMSSFFSSEKLYFPTPDVSILSDEGYSTCDYMIPQSQRVSCGHSQTCDISSLSNDSITSTSFVGDLPGSSDKCGSGIQKYCTPSNVDRSCCVTFKIKEKNTANNYNTKSTRERSSVRTDSVTEETSKPDNHAVSEQASHTNPADRPVALNHANLPNNNLTQETADVQELSTLQISKSNVDFAKHRDNGKDGCVNSNVAKLQQSAHIVPVIRQSNDSTNNNGNTAAYFFKQTAV